MLVQCPECNTKYNFSDDQIGPDGRKVRCSRCKHVFLVAPLQEKEPELPPAPVLETPLPKPQSQSAPEPSFEDELESLFEERQPEPTRQRQEESPPRPAQVKLSDRTGPDEDMVADLQGAFQQPLMEHLEQHSFDDDEASPRKKKSNWFLITVLVLLLLIAGIGAAVYFRAYWIPVPAEPGAQAPVTAPATVPESAVQIALENVRQYFVPNEKEGQLFIIEGKAVNRFAEPRELIRLKASLFDKQGVVAANQEFMCGNVVSLYQLQVAARKDIEEALSAKVGILTNNTNVQPGAAVPFMVVFFTAPETVEEFGLEVLQSSVPGQQ